MHWVSHFILDSYTCQPQVSSQGTTAVGFMEWKAGVSPPQPPRFLLFPWTQDSRLACECVIYCSTAAGLSWAPGFSTCDSGGIRYRTSSVLMATLSGCSHLLKCSKVLGKRRKGWVHQTSLINYLMTVSVTQILPSHPPPISSCNCFSLLTWKERYSSDS